MWLSLICMKLKPVLAEPVLGGVAALADPISRDWGTPPLTVQITPSPAHAMHSSRPRRLWPGPSLDASSTTETVCFSFMIRLRL